jgi:hypothetical protein
MNAKQHAALQRLAKKLSALRATSSRAERIWLDQLVLGQAPPREPEIAPTVSAAHTEVRAHQFDALPSPKKARHAPRKTPAAVLEFDPISGGYAVRAKR